MPFPKGGFLRSGPGCETHPCGRSGVLSEMSYFLNDLTVVSMPFQEPLGIICGQQEWHCASTLLHVSTILDFQPSPAPPVESPSRTSASQELAFPPPDKRQRCLFLPEFPRKATRRLRDWIHPSVSLSPTSNLLKRDASTSLQEGDGGSHILKRLLSRPGSGRTGCSWFRGGNGEEKTLINLR